MIKEHGNEKKPMFLRKSHEITIDEKEEYLKKRHDQKIIDKINRDPWIINKAFNGARIYSRVYGVCMVYLFVSFAICFFNLENFIGNLLQVFTGIIIPILIVGLAKGLDLQDEVDHDIFYTNKEMSKNNVETKDLSENKKNISNDNGNEDLLIDILKNIDKNLEEMNTSLSNKNNRYIGKGKNKIRK